MADDKAAPENKSSATNGPTSSASDVDSSSVSTLSQQSAAVGRLRAEPTRLRPADVLALQRTIGNQAVARLLGRTPSPQATPPRPVVQRRIKTGLPGYPQHNQPDHTPHALSDARPLPSELKATTNAVQRVTWSAGVTHAALIQRLAITDNPRPRVATTDIAAPGYVKKSGGGNVGVYFARDGAQEIVIKFMSKTEALRAQYADTIVRGGTDLGAPASKVFFNGSPEFTDLAADVQGWKDSPRIPPTNRLHAMVDNDITSDAVMLMDKLQGQSVDAMVEDPNQHATLLGALHNPTVIRGIAQLLVIDALLGNSDRLDRGVPFGSTNPKLSNIGNLFLSTGGQSVVTLDNDAERIGTVSGNNEQAQKNSLGGIYGAKMIMLQDVTSDQGVERTVDALLDAIVAHSTPIHGGVFSMIFTPAYRNDLKQRMKLAVKIARVDVLARLKSNKDQLKQQTKGLENTYGYTQPGNNLNMKPNWDTFRARSKLLTMRNKGKNDAEALDKAFEHWQHKDKKSKGELPRQKALKQITSFGGLRKTT